MENDNRTPKEERLYKEPIYSSMGANTTYSIFRVGKKYKVMGNIRGFQIHMQREIQVKNANTNITNEILIGDKYIYDDAIEYLKDVKLRKNSVLAREILLTASPSFFKGLSNVQLEQWKAINKQWLIDNFGANCIYAVLHKDESTWHIHGLVIPKFQNEKGEYILSNMRYFNGKAKLSEWQDNYASSMQSTFKSLSRGNKYSKAKHIDIKTFYNLVNTEFNENDIKQIAAKAKNSELMELKLKAIQKTLDAYKKYNANTTIENDMLLTDNKELRKDNEVYKEALSILSKYYNVNQKTLDQAVRYAEKGMTNERTR